MYNEIKLDNKLYNITGKSFTQALSELDPDESYEGTPLSGLDAYERQLKRFDIKVSGKNCDTVDKFFATSETAVLFPEFVKREISQGIDKYFVLNRGAASVISIDDTVYSSLSVIADSASGSVSAGSEMPAITVAPSTASSVLKFARELKLTYEVIRKRRLDTFAVLCRQLGYMIASNANASAGALIAEKAGVTSTASSDSFDYSALIDFKSAMTAFEMDTILCASDVFDKILQFTEIKETAASGILTEASTITLPFGMKIMAVPGLSAGTIIGVAKDFGYEMAVCGDVTVDIGKLISTQYDEIGASVMIGVSSLNTDAIGKLTLS